MADAWTTDRVVALAPDPSSAAAGQSLAVAKKWTGLGRSDRAIWGLCQGSGKDPYQARVDLSEPAFKCSCPSRKFPCKHGIGLLLLYAKSTSEFKAASVPGWVSDWLQGRDERQDRKTEKAKETAEKPVDVEAQARRAAKREARVQDGVASCRVWLDDLVRRGLAAARSGGTEVFAQTAARMVDAQAPGLAALVRRVPESLASGDGWEVRTLDLLGRLHLLLAAAERLESLPPDLAGDVCVALGYNQAKEEVLAGAGGAAVVDRWAVIGQAIDEEDRLTVRRSWLIGRGTGRRALVLDFAAGGQRLDASPVAGVEFEGEMAFYPSRQPLRALVRARNDTPSRALALSAGDEWVDSSVEAVLAKYAAALGQNPWLPRWPVMLVGAQPALVGHRWCVLDGSGAALPLRAGFAGSLNLWRMVSASGGVPMAIAGEWDGEALTPLAAYPSGVFFDLAPRWAA